jgi:hypothetical protein
MNEPYPTWAAQLWMDNSEYTVNEWLPEAARNASDVYDLSIAIRHHIEDDMIGEELLDTLGGSLAGDLMTYALGAIDVYAIAQGAFDEYHTEDDDDDDESAGTDG